ncbi:phage regulatory protein, Rha family [Marvinbryantia formatexigens DSM 14469]|uniref:Phage regulatory protein, Rha family n=1 Tax=Marvinbryantia formatexigens DSM 14469 TaxID=478749 RepID=C6LG85_9FIRM|nr:Rha family transcriptional regulator [Marvinbryantia formatexigens]EET60449.1 phage regulatory protein, Rha family [Marvinbryantia formatexigens DSM 14469]UWO25214.1 Rha family transcriptional regulator [Marvinbryantia formatexigens DSM 14469]SDH05782.1 phage regulatory protein, rha family [Marvinbryantia formatexigens]
MNEIMKSTITSMEVAEMVDKKHCDLLKDIRRYMKQLGEGKIPSSDFFTESTYISEQNKTVPCYLVTKKGCEFIAHKLTGQKGTEFTARYINRFHEMEEGIGIISAEKIPVGEVAKLANVMDRIAVRQNLSPHRIAANFKAICEQFGIRLTDDFVKAPEYEQLQLIIK